MTDTPAHIHQLQLAIFNGMTDGERIDICLAMMEEGRRQLEANIVQQHPDWPRGEIVGAAFERLYRDEFSSEELGRITESIREYHLPTDQAR